MHVFGRLPLPPAVVSRIVPITTITDPRGSPAQLGCFLGSFPPSWSRAISVSGRLNRAIHYMPVPKEVRWTPTTQVVNFHDGGLMYGGRFFWKVRHPVDFTRRVWIGTHLRSDAAQGSACLVNCKVPCVNTPFLSLPL